MEEIIVTYEDGRLNWGNQNIQDALHRSVIRRKRFIIAEISDDVKKILLNCKYEDVSQLTFDAIKEQIYEEYRIIESLLSRYGKEMSIDNQIKAKNELEWMCEVITKYGGREKFLEIHK